MLGYLYLLGWGVKRDTPKGAKMMSETIPKMLNYFDNLAVKYGDKNIQNLMGWVYYHGTGVPADKKKTFYYWKLAVDQDFPMAQYNLGFLDIFSTNYQSFPS